MDKLDLRDAYAVTQSLWSPDEGEGPGGPFLLALYWASVEGRVEVHGIELRSVKRPQSWGGEPEESLMLDLEAERQLPPGLARSVRPPTPLTTADLRKLKLREVAEEHKRTSLWHMRFLRRSYDRAGRAEELKRLAAEREALPKRGRRGHGQDYYVRVALTYEQAEHEGRNPAQAVAEMLGGERVNNVERELDGEAPKKGSYTYYAQATKAISRARQLGYLKPARKGANR